VRHGSASGAASGRLQANSGAGTWSVSALCSGHNAPLMPDCRLAWASGIIGTVHAQHWSRLCAGTK
jgi:hypothetical protein